MKFWQHFELAISAIFLKIAKLDCTKIKCCKIYIVAKLLKWVQQEIPASGQFHTILLFDGWLWRVECLVHISALRYEIDFTCCQRVQRFLFSGESRLISLQYSGMLSISCHFHCLSPDMFCTAFSHAKPPRNIHAAREVTLSRFQ